MARKKIIKDEIDEVELELEQNVPEVVNDAVLLKVNHTHAGTMYKAGTPIDELNPSASTLDFMKQRNIV